MKLWLDDVRPAPEGWLWCKSSVDFIRHVLMFHARGERLEAISLDHDLSGDDTGMKVVEFFEAMSYQYDVDWQFEWNVHSMNPVGADRMARTLRHLAEQGYIHAP